MSDLISRERAISELVNMVTDHYKDEPFHGLMLHWTGIKAMLEALPSAEPEQRYTKEELSVFAHGISLSLLSKRSAQHWRYDEDTATEIEFLERLYEKVGADMRGEQNG